MRRFLILFLLCLLPVQISWAAVSDYCAHEPARKAQHLGHHPDEHALFPEQGDAQADDSQNLPVSDSEQPTFGHDHCHLAGFIGLLRGTAFTPPPLPTLRAVEADARAFSSLILDRPERPKWHPLA